MTGDLKMCTADTQRMPQRRPRNPTYFVRVLGGGFAEKNPKGLLMLLTEHLIHVVDSRAN